MYVVDHIPQHDLLDLRPVGQHGDDDFGIFRQLLTGDGMGAVLRQLLHGSLAAVVYPDLMACFQKVSDHRLAHDTKTNKSDFHVTLPPGRIRRRAASLYYHAVFSYLSTL